MPSSTPCVVTPFWKNHVQGTSAWNFSTIKGRSEPWLINLSPENPLRELQLQLQSGVTMLGTGKGCVKPPQILLHGPGVAPQHCFIERFDRQEVILHPISDLTTVDGSKVTGPTRLNHGNLIRIGTSNLLEFHQPNYSNGKTESEFSRVESDVESPYALVVKQQKGPTSNCNAAGDVNKPSTNTMDALSPNHHCQPSHNKRPQPRLWRQDQVHDDYYDNGPINSTVPKYRDSLESNNFEEKLARFETMALPIPKSLSSSTLETKRRRPSPYFCRFGTNSEFKYFNDHQTYDDSNANYILQSSKAVPTLGYRRTHSVSYASSRSPYQVIPLIRSNTTDDSKLSSKPFRSQESSQSFSVQSSPSPDSVYSSHSSEGSFISYRSTVTPLDLKNTDSSDLHLTTHITPDTNFSLSVVPRPTSTLDEVLAICEAYEQQIAREIDEKHEYSNKIQVMTSVMPPREYDDSGRPPQFVNATTNDSRAETGLRGLVAYIDQTRNQAPVNFFDRENQSVESPRNATTFDLTASPQVNYPYENVSANDLDTSDCVDGFRYANDHGTETTPPKSKLSVSFSPSVEEYNVDDYIPRVSSASSSPKSSTELTSRLKTSPVVKSVTKVEIHSESVTTTSPAKASHPIPVIQEACQVVESRLNTDVMQFAEVFEVGVDSVVLSPSCKTEDPVSRLKSQIRDLEQQEMEALREMEMEKALLLGEEHSMESQLCSSKCQLEEIRTRLCQIDGGIRLWKVASAQELSGMKRKLSACERNLQRLEKMHEEFCGSTDEETALLEKLKYQHELIEVERKVYDDAEFKQLEETASKEVQRDELTKMFGENKKKFASKQTELDQLRNQNRISLAASIKEVHKLESSRQYLIAQLKEVQKSVKTDSLTLSESSYLSSNSDSDEMLHVNCDLEEKLKSLTLMTTASDDALTIEMIKSSSPIDSKLGICGNKTAETLREIEKCREFLLNEQGVQMLEEERRRVKELQKRVQTAVREEWEAARENRSNQCNSLNSVGSEESSQTISDTPTDSGSSDGSPDKCGVLSFGKTELSLDGNSCSSEQTTFELCQQMRQRQKDLSQSTSDDNPRPLSDGSAYDNRSIVTLRDKHSLQNNRPLTRYLPVRGDEDHFDLRGHIESSGHQLSMCPHLILTSTLAKGSLLKLGGRFHNWNKRWFVFDRETRTFSYYIDKSQKKPRGGIHFQAIQEVYVDHLQSVKSPSPKLTFCVKTYNRIFHLVAPSPEAMRIWVDVIFTGAEGYQEFKSTA